MSPSAWKTSFSDFHRSYNPRSSQRSSFRSPEKPRHGTLPRGSGSIAGSSHQSILVSPGSRDPDAGLSPSERLSPSADAADTPGGDGKQVEERRSGKEEEREPSAGRGEKAPPSESSSEENISCDSESLGLQLSAAADSSLRIDESDDSPSEPSSPKEKGLENGKVSGVESLSTPHKVGVLRSSRRIRTSSVFH